MLFGFLHMSFPLHLQYMQHGTPAILQGHTLLRAHFPQLQGSGKSSGLIGPLSRIGSKQSPFTSYAYSCGG